MVPVPVMREGGVPEHLMRSSNARPADMRPVSAPTLDDLRPSSSPYLHLDAGGGATAGDGDDGGPEDAAAAPPLKGSKGGCRAPMKLPPPVQVQVASRSKRKCDGGDGKTTVFTRGAVGTFHPSLYLSRGDCIEVNGEMMSRGRFERLAGTATAKWHVSIKVQPSGITLGRWLQAHGLPVLKQGRRRKRRVASSEDDDDMGGEEDDAYSDFLPRLQHARPSRDRAASAPGFKAAMAVDAAAASSAGCAAVSSACTPSWLRTEAAAAGAAGVTMADAAAFAPTARDSGWRPGTDASERSAQADGIFGVELLGGEQALAVPPEAADREASPLLGMLEGSDLLDELLDDICVDDSAAAACGTPDLVLNGLDAAVGVGFAACGSATGLGGAAGGRRGSGGGAGSSGCREASLADVAGQRFGPAGGGSIDTCEWMEARATAAAATTLGYGAAVR
ncbi:hypothetical protein GPECTOR_11g146 [Gonium pectorale]|uniref:Uncharacterized protein n=1 Tax=Gonium pectorale TaxID=33097 RepID=A0A150GPA6_GONPE|nr:hypothetical protein GPECTOR_11g146 [Gonium pectorale]|eukprot:KXZ51696.1 hypothetical protein GPECTOR_11g146 [Gonium pectorale]